MSVGDITSSARGSGARYNSGKPPVDLIPLILIAESHGYVRGIAAPSHVQHSGAVTALGELGMFQCGAGIAALHKAFAALDMPWTECANVFDFGRKKYAAWNWSKGMAWSIPLACAGRHLIEMIEGGTDDRDSKLPIVGHVACNLVMLMTFITTYTEGDDRPLATLSPLIGASTVDSRSLPAPQPQPPHDFKIEGVGFYLMRNGSIAEVDELFAHHVVGNHARSNGRSFRQHRGSWLRNGDYVLNGAPAPRPFEYDIIGKAVHHKASGGVEHVAEGFPPNRLAS